MQTPPDCGCLITLEMAQKVLPDADEQILSFLIKQVSAQIETWLDRKLGRADYIQRLKPTGGQELLLAQWPIVAVESVEQGGMVIPPDHYDFYDTANDGILYKDDGWTYDGYRQGLAGDYISAKRNITVKYTAGYILPPGPDANLPADIMGLALEMLQSAYGKMESGGNSGLKSYAIADVRWEWQTEIPQSWQYTLNMHRRWI